MKTVYATTKGSARNECEALCACARSMFYPRLRVGQVVQCFWCRQQWRKLKGPTLERMAPLVRGDT